MVLAVASVLAGLVLLTQAADHFVLGSARLARLLQLSPVIVGVVVMGFGTSAPELFVSGLAAVEGNVDLGVGNILGSNVANLALVLGCAALVRRVGVTSRVLRREVPLSAAATVGFAVMVMAGRLYRIEGAVLLAGFAGAVWLLVRAALRNREDERRLVVEVQEETDHERVSPRRRARELLRVVLGLAGVLVGAQFLVSGASDVAERLGISQGIVGVTLVAVGTSLPELVTAIASSRHGHDDLIVGNVLGSNLVNSLAVGAVVALAGAGALADPGVARRAAVASIVVVAVSWVVMGRRLLVDRVEGGVLLGLYAAMVPLLVL
ncbi:calcium/sodium antiporter [Rhabdothermincola sediminis]|uniref:calcium/sodium antiporter n=1 Tax=Rhabdothermincola sediminis TaxID=2751370 RepID=UPI001AA042F1|nr:calcium/sodium antiporter [Rhabdothermincola sediminis]